MRLYVNENVVNSSPNISLPSGWTSSPVTHYLNTNKSVQVNIRQIASKTLVSLSSATKVGILRVISPVLVVGQTLGDIQVDAQFIMRTTGDIPFDLYPLLSLRVVNSISLAVVKDYGEYTSSTLVPNDIRQNRTFSHNFTGADYTTIFGDCLVFDFGCTKPSGFSDSDSVGYYLDPVDNDIDLPVDETTSTRDRCWIDIDITPTFQDILNDSLTITDSVKFGIEESLTDNLNVSDYLQYDNPYNAVAPWLMVNRRRRRC